MGQIKFRPYRGTDENIKAIPYSEGYIYFATDTGKIYLDYNQERSTMGGNGASLFYALDAEVTKDLHDRYEINISSLEDESASVKVNDLIINSDGSFYKALEVNADLDIIYCSRIAVSGTGGGGGGGDDSGGGSGGASISLVSTQDVPMVFAYGRPFEVGFRATATADTYVNITLEVNGINNQKNTVSIGRVVSGVEFFIDIGSHVFAGTNRIVVIALGDNSGSTTKTYASRSGVLLDLKKNETGFNPRLVFDGDVGFSYIPIGAVAKTLEIFCDGSRVASKTIEAAVSDQVDTITIPKQSHGVHKIKAVLSATIGTSDIETNPIEYELAWQEAGNKNPLVWTPNLYSTEIVQYEDLFIDYMVWDPEKEKEIETHFYKNGIELANSPRLLSYNTATTLRWNITDYSVGLNSYTIGVGTSSKPINVTVKKDELRNLEIETGGLILNLDSSGRSNEESPSNRASWISKHGNPTAVKFNNFNWYNNGWIADENGNSCMRISNGASLSIPITALNIFNTTSVTQAISIEFRFKVRNVQEYATLITTTSVEDDEGKPIITKTVSTERGVFARLFGNNRGFCLGTQEAFFKSDTGIVNARYREDEIINLTFVIDANTAGSNALLYIYLNGINSGISKYDTTTDNFNIGSDIRGIEFLSDWCDIDLYNVRIYKGSKLDDSMVVHNLNADYKDVKAYDANKITTSTNGVPTIDYLKMLEYNAAHPDETIMPYMVIKSKDSDNKLPFVKGGKKPVDIEFHNPALDYAWEQGYISYLEYLFGAPSFKFTGSMEKTLDVQGTSSQGYPIRNFKWKAKAKDAEWVYLSGPLEGKYIYKYDAAKDKYYGETYENQEFKKWYMDSEIGETTFCFKADYMESSGTHNTGFATYANELYSKHPLNDYGIATPNGVRTTIYGFPMLIFQEMPDKTYKFIGRYNFNFDKACEDTFGFTLKNNSKVKNDDGSFKTMEEVAECWELLNNQGQRCSFVKTDFAEPAAESYTKVETLTQQDWKPDTYYVVSGINTSTGKETYELSTAYDPSAVYYTKKANTLAVLDDFEPRYSVNVDDFEDAMDGKGKFESQSQEDRNTYILDVMSNLEIVAEWLKSTDTTAASNEVLPSPVQYGSMTYNTDSAEYRLAKFSYEFSDHFDREYCEVYYIMTELLHMYDSRGKNCMLASWGSKVECTVDDIKNQVAYYIWYPIFYDIDTQLGINNSGVPTWDYYDEASKNNMFSTSNSVLWNNLYAAFGTSIMSRYEDLRKGNLTIERMDGYYNAYPIPGYPEIDSWKQIAADPATMEDLKSKLVSYAKIGRRPAMIYNVDEYFKYIAPSRSGYTDTTGATAYSNAFFYALQGTRELMRYLYLRNRMNFRDSEWNGGAYSAEAVLQQLKARYDANNYAESGGTSDKYLVAPAGLSDAAREENEAKGFIYIDESEYPNELDTIGDFNGVRPYLRQYMSYWMDKTHSPEVVLYNGIDPETGKDTIDLPMPQHIRESVKSTPNFTQQLIYIGGGEYIADLGDMSRKYVDELNIAKLKRLKRLKLGNDHPDYYNAQLQAGAFDLGASAMVDNKINPNAKTLLESVVLTGVSALDGIIDVSGSEKLKEFRALKTLISGVSLAEGVQIETLHLPNTVTTLNLIEPVALNGVLEEAYDQERNPLKGLYIEGLTNANDYTKNMLLSTYSIVGGSLGYDSYKLLDKIVKFKQNAIDSNSATNSKELRTSLKNVNWSPYTVVAFGESYDPTNSSKYFIDKGRFKLEVYNHESDAIWERETLNGNIYLLDTDYFAANESAVVDLSILDVFIDDYKKAVIHYENNYGSLSENHYKNTSESTTVPTLPEITGIMYVNNTKGYSEDEIQNSYLTYFPNLKIFFKNLTPAYVATYVSEVDGVETVIFTQREKAQGEVALIYPDPEKYTPIRLNYDFKGWSLSKEGEALKQSEIEAMKFSATNNYYKFYAIFEIHSYIAYFYNVVDDRYDLITLIDVPSGEPLRSPSVVPIIDESALPDDMRYTCLGYVADPALCYPATKAEGLKNVVDLTSIISENTDRNFYACYIQENVKESASPNEYFEFASYTYEGVEGYLIRPHITLAGKITIPAEYNSKPILRIESFSDLARQVTHIYFMNPENMKVIGSNCFYTSDNDYTKRLLKLKVFDWPSGLEIIEAYAFTALWTLKYDAEAFGRMTKLKTIQNQAFRGAFAYKEPIDELILPGSLTRIGDLAFGRMIWPIYPAGIPENERQNIYVANRVIFGSKDSPCKLETANFGTQSFTSDISTPYKSFIMYRDSSTTTLQDALALEDFVFNSNKILTTTPSFGGSDPAGANGEYSTDVEFQVIIV